MRWFTWLCRCSDIIFFESVEPEPVVAKLVEPAVAELVEPVVAKLVEPVVAKLVEPAVAKLVEPVVAKLSGVAGVVTVKEAFFSLPLSFDPEPFLDWLL